MSSSFPLRPIAALLAVGLLSGCVAQANSRGGPVDSRAVGRQIPIEYGRILSVETVSVDEGVATGALVGGGIGLATGGGHGAESKALRTVAGALIGALTQKALSDGATAQSYLIRKNNGTTIKVITPADNIFAGDCVVIESQPKEVQLHRTASNDCRDGGVRGQRSSYTQPSRAAAPAKSGLTLFGQMDNNADGRISWQEFRGDKSGPSLRKAERRFDVADENQDGLLTRVEFKSLF